MYIREKNLGYEHLDTAMSYNNIARFYLYNFDYENALKYFQKALPIYIKRVGNKCPDTAKCYHNIAWTLYLMARFKEALRWAKKAMEILPENTNIINTLAYTYYGLGQYEEALKHFELCKKLQTEQNDNEDNILESEIRIAQLNGLIKNEGVSEQ